ncbi:endo alpha-1,4 polygalactosaminidase [Streptomyces sp. bgisy034]|uniref:endo alpha-1,4 polygalactosaminidase n=1 Tax=Streptomyces sp. bgisy034 TaxID=3413774 RepID=UPI003EB9A950
MAFATPLSLKPAQAAVTKTLPPTAGSFDYQIGGPYTPAPDVQIVSRDHGATPAPGLYNICYVNAFQTQPGASAEWEQNLLLHDSTGALVEDPDWPGEYMLDVRTEANRQAIFQKVKVWLDECASKGFDAIEPDNYDHYTRSNNLIDPSDSEKYMKLLVDYSHSMNLAIAQKNTLELAGDAASLGIDFAVVEECGVIWPGADGPECPEYYAAFGDRIINIEYTDAGMTRACDAYAGVFSIVQRDVAVTPNGPRKTCSAGSSGDTQAPTAPSGLSATGATSSSVSLSWNASTDNVLVTGYDVYRGGTKVGTAPGTSYTDSGLTAATTYQYQVRAKDDAGNVSAASNTVTEATLSDDSGSAGCTATFVVTGSWSDGFDAEVSVKNTGSATTSSWLVTWDWPGNQEVTDHWDTELTQSGSAVTATNDDYNGAIAPAATTAFGLMASGDIPANLPSATCTVS